MKTLSRRHRETLLEHRLQALRAELASQVRSVRNGTLRNPYRRGYPPELLRQGQFTGSVWERPAWWWE